jgi:hypothetical protein
VFASRKGVGKTACLVHIATDRLMQGLPVIHVSYASRVDHIINWYEDIFREIAKKRQLESAVDIHDEIVRNRVIMNFKQDGAKTEQVLKSVQALIQQGRFSADTAIVDGFDFRKSTIQELKQFKDFARDLELELWFSSSLKGEEPLFDEQGVPHELKDYLSEISVLITLYYKEDHIQLSMVKDHEYPSPGELDVKLDHQTMLISE